VKIVEHFIHGGVWSIDSIIEGCPLTEREHGKSIWWLETGDVKQQYEVFSQNFDFRVNKTGSRYLYIEEGIYIKDVI